MWLVIYKRWDYEGIQDFEVAVFEDKPSVEELEKRFGKLVRSTLPSDYEDYDVVSDDIFDSESVRIVELEIGKWYSAF